jgi:predicted Zn-dependent peptidase
VIELVARPGIEIGPRRTQFDNGLTVVSEWVPGVRSVALGAWVKYGTAHETAEQMGISHLLEHMVFKGTAKRDAKQLALALEVRGGSLDAFTSREHTVFEAHILPRDVTLACDVIGDIVFAPRLTAADLKLEHKVILEEIATADETPEDIVFDLHTELLWPGNSYGYPILGTTKTVPSINTSALRARHQQTFRPERIVVAAAGDLDHDALVAALRETGWDAQPGGRTANVHTPIAPIAAAPGSHHVERDLTQVHVVLGAPALARRDPLESALALVSNTLGGGMSSRLFQRVREELGLAYAVYTFSSSYHLSGMHGMYVASADDTAADAVNAIREELQRMATEGLSAAEVADGRDQLKGQVLLALEGSGATMSRVAAPAVHDEPPRTIEQVLAEIDEVTTDQVAEVCERVLHPDRQTILSLGPRAAA